MTRIEGTVEEQIRLEKLRTEEGINKALSNLQKSIDRDDFSSTVYGLTILKLGFKEYVEKLKEYFKAELFTHQRKTREFIELFTTNVDVIAYVVLIECINSGIKNKPLTQTSIRIIRRLKELYMVERLKRDNPKLHTYLGAKFRRANRKQKRELISFHIEELYSIEGYAADSSLKQHMLKAGNTLINLLELSGANVIEVLDIDNKALSSIKHSVGTTKKVCLSSDAINIIQNIDSSSFVVDTINKLPMVVPPKDWTTVNDGGFLSGNNFLFTVRSEDVTKYLKKEKHTKLFPIINKLQKTAFRVNTNVLDVVNYIFNNNLICPKSPVSAPTLYGGLPPSKVYDYKDFISRDDYKEWKVYNSDREEIKIRLTAINSRRIDLMFTLNVAETMKKYATLYFPYVLDYRGRIYSDVNFLTPQGQHYTKAMLEFAEGRKIDDDGVFWLKVHIANVYGKDKEEYEDRVQWVEDNEADIIAVAEDPLSNLDKWVYADSPYEYLAACYAWVDYINNRPVHLPIQLDATCSGIQMYSGLVRDKEGAEAVNVIGDKRNDIYQIVADKVNEKLANNEYNEWIEYTDKEGVKTKAYTRHVGKSMVGKITRKIVKRNVMTVPYSVTRKGMSNQLWDIMDDARLTNSEFWEGDRWIANSILTELNHVAIYETIKGAKQGQEFLLSLSSLTDEPAMWKGVLYDFPVRQTSLNLKETRVKTLYGTLKLNKEIPTLNRKRQSNSIAPNFIHNIDSTILMYVIDNMKEQIGVIHDCFLVHPNDGYKVQETYKEGFIEVMKANPLRNIQQQLDPDREVEFPEFGDLDLDDVRNSKYIIS